MRLYLNDFTLLRGKHYCVTSEDGFESVLVSNDEFWVLDSFFKVIDYIYSPYGKDLRRDRLESRFQVSHADNLCYGDFLIAKTIYRWSIREFMLLGGYLYIILSIGVTTYASLVVLEKDTFRFVGCISKSQNNVCSGELSRLVLAVPEIDWSGI